MNQLETYPDDSSAIAIIGMAGRFPGARDLDELWKVIVEGRDTISRFTPEECDGGDPDIEAVRGAQNYIRARGVLEGAADFDAEFFEMAPAEAAATDPQHRIWLEVAWEALEAAGYAREGHGQVIGVFAGAYTNTYLLHNLLPDRAAIEEYVRMRRAQSLATLLQNDPAFLPTRTAYKLDLRGPAINVQTACSTSLVAVAQAVQSLRNYESDLCVAGGVCIGPLEPTGYFYQEGAIVSRDGVCRPYDAQACGTVFSNGVGAVVLKRLSDARCDGDRVRALILGTALNNDGHAKVSFAAPSVAGQAEVIAAAQTIAGVSPDSIGYIEGHGTATPLGDPIEVEALTRAFRSATERTQFCALGSLKGNLGHLDAAAGVASLIRTVLALEHRTLLPTAHFKEPNPGLRLEQTPFFVLSEARPWEASATPRRAGVSSFGIGGTNAHVVLEEAPTLEAPAGAADRDEPQTLIVSAKNLAALDANTQTLAQWLERRAAAGDPGMPLSDVAYTLYHRKKLFPQRRALFVKSWSDAAAALQDSERWITGVAPKNKPKLFFAFPGQGTLAPGQLVELLAQEADFRAYLEPLARATSERIGLDLMRWFEEPNADLSAIREDNAKSQLAVFCVDVALARWLEARGAVADGLLGHSLGEWVALHMAGVLTLEDAIEGVYHRGRLMQSTGRGAALIVRLSEEAARPYAVGEIVIACVNGPQLVLLSGPVEAIDTCAKRLQADNVAHRAAPIDVAVHSSRMDAVLDPFREQLRKLRWSAAQRPILSTVTGEWLDPQQATDVEYWTYQIRKPVLFDRAAQKLFEEPSCIALEVGLGSSLTGLLAARRRDKREQRALAALGRHEEGPYPQIRLRQCLAELFVNGAALDLMGPLPTPVSAPDLPTYAFQRKRYVVEPPATVARVAADKPVPKSDAGRAAAAQPFASAAAPNQRSDENAPHDEVEARIAQIFEHILGVPQPSVHESFFELGGHSLLAVAMTAELTQAFGLSFSLGAIFERPTIAQLAQAVREGGAETKSSVITLRRGSDQLPFYFICGIQLYQELANRLGEEQASYGIFLPAEERFFKPGHEVPTVEELSRMYVEAMREHRPHGPYLVGGVSFGGLLAYEMARQLRTQGEEVPLLVIIDTILPSSLKRNARKWLAYKYREARETGLRAAVLRTGQRVWQRYRDGSVLSPGVGLESMGDSNDVRLQIYSMAAGAYVKTDHGYAGSTLVIRALDSMDMVTFDVDTDLGWSRHVRGPLRVFEAPGDHLGTLREQDTGDIVRREIEEVRRHLKTAQSSSTR